MPTCLICQKECSNYLYVQSTPVSGQETRSERIYVCGEHIGSLALKLRSDCTSPHPRIFLGSTPFRQQHEAILAG